ncbi:MAG: ATP-binding protein [Lysobacterales bacterium]
MIEAQNLMDTQLDDTASLLMSMPQGPDQVLEYSSERLAWQIWSAAGSLLVRSDNSGENPMTSFKPGYRDTNFEGHRWRVLSLFDSQYERWIQVAERIDVRVDLADDIIFKSVQPIVFSLPVIAMIVWLVVGNGLSMISGLAKELGAKKADDLGQLKTKNPPKELAPVVNAVNDLLLRLENSVASERRFSADAAHELRTPLAALNIHLHNLKQAYPEHLDDLATLDHDVGRLGHLIQQILLLHRMSPEHYQAQMQLIDLHQVAQEVIGNVFPELDQKGQTVSLTGHSANVLGDRASLEILVSNLLLNAHKYSPEGAEIELSTHAVKAGVELTVTDNGPGLSNDDKQRAVDRFYRAGGDRHASKTEGAGLGLSIVTHIANLHLTTLSLVDAPGKTGLRAKVNFPNVETASSINSDQGDGMLS